MIQSFGPSLKQVIFSRVSPSHRLSQVELLVQAIQVPS